MRKSLFVLPLLAAGFVFACSSAEKRSGFETDTPHTDPDDGGGNMFAPNGNENDPNKDDGGCGASSTSLTRTPVVLEFVVDESGSMKQQSKWTSQRDALLAAFNDMNKTQDPALFVGVQLFDTSPTTSVRPKPFTDPSQNDDLNNLIDKPEPNGGGTGTNAALTVGYKVVDKFKPPTSAGFDTTNMKRIVVLMTDGEPTGGTDEQNQCIQDATDELAQTPPVLTFAIGVGMFPAGTDSGYDPVFMGHMAQAGGTAPAGCDPAATDVANVCHFQVTPGDDPQATKDAFIAALNKIRAATVSCEFGFKISDGADPNNVIVTMTGADGKVTVIKKDATNGWTFDNPAKPTKVILHGNACSASNGTVSGRVDVTFGCNGAK